MLEEALMAELLNSNGPEYEWIENKWSSEETYKFAVEFFFPYIKNVVDKIRNPD